MCRKRQSLCQLTLLIHKLLQKWFCVILKYDVFLFPFAFPCWPRDTAFMLRFMLRHSNIFTYMYVMRNCLQSVQQNSTKYFDYLCVHTTHVMGQSDSKKGKLCRKWWCISSSKFHSCPLTSECETSPTLQRRLIVHVAFSSIINRARGLEVSCGKKCTHLLYFIIW